MRSIQGRGRLFVVAATAVVAVGVSVYFYSKERHPIPNQTHLEAKTAEAGHEARSISAEHSSEHSDKGNEMGNEKSAVENQAKKHHETPSANHAAVTSRVEMKLAFPVKKTSDHDSSDAHGEAHDSSDSSVEKTLLNTSNKKESTTQETGVGIFRDESLKNLAEAKKDTSMCQRLEYLGSGFQNTQVAASDWQKVVEQFHHSKKELQSWISMRKEVGEKTQTLMKEQVENLKIVPPPSVDDHDLSWRGVGIWTRDDQGSGVVRIGGGFIQLAKSHPKRAQFELTRLVAQALAPCELRRKGSDENTWKFLLDCLDIDEEHYSMKSCESSANSESAWAVSSSIAVVLDSPGCTLPAFTESSASKCLDLLRNQKQAETSHHATITAPVLAPLPAASPAITPAVPPVTHPSPVVSVSPSSRPSPSPIPSTRPSSQPSHASQPAQKPAAHGERKH